MRATAEVITSAGLKVKVWWWALLLTYALLWAGGVGSQLTLGATPPGAAWAAPAFLFAAGLIVLLSAPPPDQACLAGVALLGFAAEVAGSHSGLIFGRYRYTDALFPQVWGVPLAMACAWLILSAYVKQMITAFALPAWLEVVAASLWLTALDLVIDPLAAGRLGYWHWLEGGRYYGVPLHNFLGWFAVGLVTFGLLRAGRRGRWGLNRWAGRLGLSVVAFFTIICWRHGLLWAGVGGVALAAVHFGASHRRPPAAGGKG